MLNRKGYITTSSCSGHIADNGSTSYLKTYVTFPIEIYDESKFDILSSLPDEFMVEITDTEFIIYREFSNEKSRFREMLKGCSDLYVWSKHIPMYEKNNTKELSLVLRKETKSMKIIYASPINIGKIYYFEPTSIDSSVDINNETFTITLSNNKERLTLDFLLFQDIKKGYNGKLGELKECFIRYAINSIVSNIIEEDKIGIVDINKALYIDTREFINRVASSYGGYNFKSILLINEKYSSGTFAIDL